MNQKSNPTIYKVQPGPQAVRRAEGLVLHDAKRNKDLQLNVTYPDGPGPFPVIYWSHGAWASKDDYRPLVAHWVSHGYVVIQANHQDSMKLGVQWGDATAFRDWPARPADVSFILDSLGKIEELAPDLKGRLDHVMIGVGGHSYGAHTAQLVSGVTVARREQRASYADSRVKAGVLMSGQGRGEGLDEDSWRTMTIPVIVITGSKDLGRAGQSWTWRVEPFEFSPPGDKYYLFIEDAYHGFGGLTGVSFGRGAGPKRQDHVDWVFSATTAFWDRYLKGSGEAGAFLNSKTLEEASQGRARITSK